MKKIMVSTLYLIAFFTGYVDLAAKEIIFSKGVDKKMKASIERDLQVLEDMNFDEFSADTLKVLGLSQNGSSSLKDWLEERVSVVIDEKAFKFLNLPLNKSVKIEKYNVDYPYQNITPFSLNQPKETEPEVIDSEQENLTVMTNIGTALYFNGKNKNQLLSFNLATGFLRSSSILINSPRAGIIQIGAGLFDRRFNINNNNVESVANSINRLGTLFHEARHSDGHGESLGFAHAICPKGHDLEGLNACDESLNGSYSVGAKAVSEMIDACQDECSARELEILKLTVLDSYNRVLPKTYKGEASTFWEATPEYLE